MLEKIKEATLFVKQKTGFEPEVGIILGTGLGRMVDLMDIKTTLDYESIPHFPLCTVEGHTGRLVFGILGGKKVVAMQGRFHYYEGYTMEQVTFPVRIMKFMGINYLLISNASGGMNPDFEVGDLMILNDHINLIPSPLIGKHHKELGARFPDMSEPYDLDLIAMGCEIARKNGIKAHEGCYVAVTGPALETPKEYEFLRTIGGDAVGMSTVPEVIVARQMDLPCFALSVITDLGIPGKIVKITLDDVKKAAEKAEPQMTLLMKQMLASL